MNTNELLLIKVGSSSLLDGEGKLSSHAFTGIARQLGEFSGDIAIVSSGAIAAGCETLGVSRQQFNDDIVGLRALAAAGQVALAAQWQRAFNEQHRVTSQFLITPYEMGIQHESKHFIETLEKTLSMGMVPIINENDAIADEEIKVGDNDRLSALIAAALRTTGKRSVVKLVLLSDIDGLYAEYGTSKQSLITSVTDIEPVMDFAHGSGSAVGTGGMRTKLEAARIAVAAGVDMYIANVQRPDVLKEVLLGKTGTHFVSKQVT